MIESLQHPIFQIVKQASFELGYKSYVVGGYVRDHFLNRSSKDVDFVTVGNGIDLAKKVASKLPKSHLSYFKNFGTAQIKTEDWEFEFVGARKESYRRDSRKPIVEDGTLEEDIERRDFTINALAIDLNQDSFGCLIDLHGGIKDLQAGILRTPLDPKTTFDDDPLRMMRAARFASQLNFEIEERSLAEIKPLANRIQIVSIERVMDEVNKIIASPKPSVGFNILFDTGLLHEFFPDMVALHGVETINGMSHKDNFYHTLEVLDNVASGSENLWLRWAAIMHDIAKPPTKRFDPKIGFTFHGHEDKGARMTKGIFKRLKMPLNEHLRYVQKLVQLHLRPIALTKEHITDSAIRRLIFDAGDEIDDLLFLCKCDITSKNEKKVKKYLNNLKLVKEKIELVEERDRIRNWQPPIDGNEIMKIFGLGAGKEIGLIKNSLKDAILDGVVNNNYNEAYNFVLEKGNELGLNPTD